MKMSCIQTNKRFTTNDRNNDCPFFTKREGNCCVTTDLNFIQNLIAIENNSRIPILSNDSYFIDIKKWFSKYNIPKYTDVNLSYDEDGSMDNEFLLQIMHKSQRDIPFTVTSNRVEPVSLLDMYNSQYITYYTSDNIEKIIPSVDVTHLPQYVEKALSLGKGPLVQFLIPSISSIPFDSLINSVLDLIQTHFSSIDELSIKLFYASRKMDNLDGRHHINDFDGKEYLRDAINRVPLLENSSINSEGEHYNVMLRHTDRFKIGFDGRSFYINVKSEIDEIQTPEIRLPNMRSETMFPRDSRAESERILERTSQNLIGN